MNIIDTIKEGLRISRTARALWLYGFFVGLWTTFNFGGKSHAPPGTLVAHVAPHALTTPTALLAIAILIAIVAVMFMYFVSEGALIEGVARVRRAKPTTVGEGWHDGLAHWGVLLRIAVIYFATSTASLVALAVPALLALKLSGTVAAIALAIPAALIAMPWLATLYMWQAFAARIAVIENRQARDAFGKARLFMHGRLLQGLQLIIAAILGRLIVLVVGALGLVVAGLCIFGVLAVVGMAHTTGPVIVLGAMALLPIVLVLVAISGATQSSIWTIGYLTQEQK